MKWLNKYKKGGYTPDYTDGTKYPQVGPRDWMNKHGWYAQEGGRYTQWGDFPDDSTTPGYQDYGSMYTVPGWPGLLYKTPKTEDWGMGNPANLIQTDYSGFTGYSPGTGTSYEAKLSIAKPQKSTYHTNENADYSVDSVRMKTGGKITGRWLSKFE